MKEQININITPRLDCKICWSKGMVKGGSVPMPFGSGSCSLPDEFCDCVIEQIPDDENEYNIIIVDPDDEQWEIAIGGNFLQIWHAGRYATMKYLSFEDGEVAEIALPNVHMREDLSYDRAIALMLPRARKIAAAPEMFRLLLRILPSIEAEQLSREAATYDNDDQYPREMRELANDIRTLTGFIISGSDPESASDPAADDYDYAADDQNFDANRERRN